VIFDLWETLIDWDREAAAAMVAAVSEHAPDFVERWPQLQNRYTGPIRVALTDAGVPASALEDVCALRLQYVRDALVPRAGAVETLQRLRELGVLIGLITVCSGDVEELWPSSAFAGLFDAEVFSSAVGLSKPDPRIYRHCCELLGIEPSDAVFVGDGANDELAGAERVGMRTLLIHRPGEPPYWDGLERFAGPRVTSIPEVLEVLELC
jgi:putative hydrolase of the HAD superfamily